MLEGEVLRLLLGLGCSLGVAGVDEVRDGTLVSIVSREIV